MARSRGLGDVYKRQALCTSSLDAETPRCAYLFEVSELM
jgi:hypothetical protein